MLRKERLQLAKQEYEKRRKSMQIYQVKGPTSKEPLATQPEKTVQTVKTNADRIKPPPSIKLAQPVRTIKPSAPTATKPEPTKDGNTTNVRVRTFEEIMEEKRLRKQREMPAQQKKIDAKPIQSFLRRRSLSNQRNNPASVAEETTPFTEEVPSEPKPGEQRVPSPVPAVDAEVKLASSPPVAKIVGRRRSSSPNINPGESKVAPVKIKRNLSNSDVKPLISSSSNLSTLDKKSESSELIIDSVDNIPNGQNDVFTSQTNEHEELSQASMEDIQEALEEKKRQHEQDILSDEEFEKEMNDLLSDGDDDVDDDSNDDDFMMELEQMIDS